MPLPNFTDIASLDEFKNLPFKKKEETIDRYWNDVVKENPQDFDYAKEQNQTAKDFYKANDQYSRANAFEKRQLAPVVESLEFNLKAKEGLKRGILNEETYNAGLADHNERLAGLQTKMDEAVAFGETVKRKESSRASLRDTLIKNNLFNSATTAMSGSPDTTIKRKKDGSWDLPLITTTDNSITAGISGLVTMAEQKLGGRADSLASDSKVKLQDAFDKFQKDNNLSDEEVQGAWNDLTRINRKMAPTEKGRVLTDGTILPNMQNGDWLDTEEAGKLIDSFDVPEFSKELSKSRLPEIQKEIADQKLKAYAAASVVNPLESPDDWAKRKNRKDDFGSPKFVKDYEDDVASKSKWTQGLIADLQQGNIKVASTLAGLGGVVGNKASGQKGAEMSQAGQLVGQGSFDTGIYGSIVEELPSLAVQIALTRGIGNAFGAGAAESSAILTAGGQSAGATYSEQISQGASEEEARSNALKAGVNTAVITGLFEKIGAGGFESFAAGKSIANISMRDLFQATSKKELAKNYAKFAGSLAKSAGGEGAEEFIDEATAAFINANPDTNLSDAWDNSIQALKVGAAIGGTVDVVQSVAKEPTYKKDVVALEDEANAALPEEVLTEVTGEPDLKAEAEGLKFEISQLPPESEARLGLEDRLAEVEDEINTNSGEISSSLVVGQDLGQNQQQEVVSPLETTGNETVMQDIIPAETVTTPNETVTEPQPTQEGEVAVGNDPQISQSSSNEDLGAGAATTPQGAIESPTTPTENQSPTPAVETPTDTLPEGQTSPEGRGEVAVVPPITPPPPSNESPEAQPAPESDVVGIRKSMNTALRKKYGLLEDPTIRIENETRQAIDEADAELEKNPNAGAEVVDSLETSGRIATTKETALLSHELTKAVNELDAAQKQVARTDGDEGTRAGRFRKEAEALEKFNRISTLLLSQGRAKSLTLNAQKIIRRKNYSFDGMLQRALSAKNKGSAKPQSLTAEETAEIKAKSEKIAISDKELAQAVSEAYAEGRLDAEREAAEKSKKEVRGAKKTKAEKVADLERQRKDARKRLDDRKKRRASGEESVNFAGVPVTEEDVSDIKIIATSYIQEGFVNLADFTAKLVSEFGESVRKFASSIFEESQALLSAAGVVKTPAQLVAEMDATKPINRRSVGLIVKQYYQENINYAPDDIVKKLQTELKAKWPKTTLQQASDAWTGYGQESATPQTRSELVVAQAKGKRAILLTRQIEALKDGTYKGKKKTKKEVDSEIADLTKERNRLLKEAKIAVPRDPLVAAKSRLKRETEALEQAVANNELVPKKNRTTQTDGELDALKARRDEAKALYEDAFADQNVKINAKERQILDIQEAIRKNEMLPEKQKLEKVTTELDEQLKTAKAEYNELFKENGPKLTAKERAFLDLQNAIDKNQLLPETPANKKEKSELDNQITELRKKYNEQFKVQGTQLTPNEEIDRVVKVLDKQIERLEKQEFDDAKKPDFSWFSPEIAERRKRADVLRETRNELRYQERSKAAAIKAIAVLDDILATGNLPETSKRKPKYTPDEKLQALLDERNQKQKEVAELRKEGLEYAAAEKSLKEYERRIRERDFETKAKTDNSSQRVKDIRAQRDAARKELARLRNEGKPRKSAEDKLVDAINRNTAKYRQRIKDGDFSREKKNPLDTEKVRKAIHENEKIKTEWKKRLGEIALQNKGNWEKFLRTSGAVASLAKMIKLAGDLGNLFRNVVVHPTKLLITGQWIRLFKFYKSGIKAAIDFTGQDEFNVYNAFENHPKIQEYGGSKKLGLKTINPLDSGSVDQEAGATLDLIERLAEMGPIASKGLIGKSVGTTFGSLAKVALAMERANRTWSTIARAEMFISLTSYGGRPIDLKEAQKIARNVNTVMGYGSFSRDTAAGKAFENAVPFLNNTLALSARWSLAKIQYVLGIPIWTTPGLPNKLRVVRDAYIAHMAGRYLMGAILKAAFLSAKGEVPDDLEEWEKEFITGWNPWDSENGGKLDFDGTKVSFDGGNDSFLSIVAKSIPFAQDGVWERREIKDGKWVVIKGADLERKWWRYFGNRINPVLAQGIRTAITQENFDREPLTLMTGEGQWNLAKEWFEPIIASDIEKIYENHGPEGVLLFLSAFHGANLRFKPNKPVKKSTSLLPY